MYSAQLFKRIHEYPLSIIATQIRSLLILCTAFQARIRRDTPSHSPTPLECEGVVPVLVDLLKTNNKICAECTYFA